MIFLGPFELCGTDVVGMFAHDDKKHDDARNVSLIFCFNTDKLPIGVIALYAEKYYA